MDTPHRWRTRDEAADALASPGGPSPARDLGWFDNEAAPPDGGEQTEDAADVAAAREALTEGGPLISSADLRAELGLPARDT